MYKEKTKEIMNNNFITNYKELTNSLKDTINKYKLSNLIIQNKIYIITNKLYCETNIFILKTVLYNLGFSNYKIIYEEELYKDLYKNILCIWNNNGIYIEDDKEYFIDLYNKEDVKKIKENTLLITHNKEIINRINKDLIIYEDNINPIFKLIEEKY